MWIRRVKLLIIEEKKKKGKTALVWQRSKDDPLDTSMKHNFK